MFVASLVTVYTVCS